MTTIDWEGDSLYERHPGEGYIRRCIAHVLPFEGEWALRFFVAVNGQYRFTGFETEQDAKNMAIILWRANNE
jgi:hypothetical protein